MSENKLHAEYTILVVDDDAEFRRSQRRLLSLPRHVSAETSFKVLEAETGEAAMKILAQETVACLLLDYRMPGGDGTVWLTRIHEEYPNVAVVMMTGCGTQQVAAKAMRDGAMDYLVKGDVSTAEMEHAILNAIEKMEMRKTIESQRELLIDAERRRAMIASLCAACHHLGQPVTVLSLSLEMMKKKESDPEMCSMISECIAAVNSVYGVIHRLQHVSEYRTESYLRNGLDESRESDAILKI